MVIKKIEISNFKSFRDLDVQLGNFNVLIGANASGKTNFVEIFRFLRDIAAHGLNNAISMQGGIEYLRNISIGSSKDFSLQIVSDQKVEFPFHTREGSRRLARTYEAIYEFAVEFREIGRGFRVSADKLTLRCNFFEHEKQKGKMVERAKIGSGDLIISHIGREVKAELHLSEGVAIKKDDLLPRSSPLLKVIRSLELPSRALLIENPIPMYPFFLWFEDLFADIAIYDFDPRLPKKAVRIVGKMELEEDGSNLAIVLKNIRRDWNKRRSFSNLMIDLLPFVEDWRVKAFAADKSLLFTLRETYSPGVDIPASLVSDGTINIAALIIALYFEEKSLAIIEEPERNIHPYLISKVVDMLKEASSDKQIIVTTHNPEIVKHADLESILLISRDKEGFSTILRPLEKEEVKQFLENEMGIDELYVKNLLGV